MRLIDSFPTDRIGDIEYRIGRVFPFGATLVEDGGVNFSIFSKEATGCTLLLFHHGAKEPFVEIPIPERFRIGNVFSIMLFHINIETTEYGYRFGPTPRKKDFCMTGKKSSWIPMQSLSAEEVYGVKSRILRIRFPTEGRS